MPSSSPDDNPIEFLWKKVKTKAAHNRYFSEFAKPIQSVEDALVILAALTEEIVRLMGAYIKLLIRQRLEKRLDLALEQHVKALLLSAAAGSGKTTLLAEWIAGRAEKAAWLSLDAEDNDPARFWRYLVAALLPTHPAIVELTQSPQLPPQDLLLTTLANEISGLPPQERLILVIDDYHLITNQEIHRGMAFLLEHQPPQLLVILSTRIDPPLPISRLRAKGQLAELRADDLRFTLEEAGHLVKAIASLDLRPEEISLLETRTEGWAVGLQLAALDLRQSI